jgi:hypothetical protein
VRTVIGPLRAVLLAAALWVVGAAGLAAQDSVLTIRPEVRTPDSVSRGRLPPEILQEVIRRYNDSVTTRVAGSFPFPQGSRLTGPLAVFRGSLRVSGVILGRVTVINGDLIVDPGARIEGDALVVGGAIIVRAGGLLIGARREYPTPALLTRTADGLVVVWEPPPSLRDVASARTTFTTGHFSTTLGIETGLTYNRVEGLPIVFGPTVSREGLKDVDARLDLRGIVWTAPDRTDRRSAFGYSSRLEVRFGERRRLTVGGQLYRTITPIEEQPLSRTEAGWSAFFFQRDYRDFYQSEGLSGYVSYALRPGLSVGASVRHDAERSVPANDPISILRNDAWRPNPLVDDGHYTTWRVNLDLDTRNDRESPTNGWLVHAHWEKSVSLDAAPLTLPDEVRDPIAPGRYSSAKIWLDARRYARFDPSVRGALHVVAGGWIDGDPLAVQRRLSLGGPDILPGYGFRSMNCAPASLADPSRPALCDRLVAAQLEVRTRTRIGLPFATPDPYVTALQRLFGIREPDVVIFGDLGKSWISGTGPGRVPNDRLPVLREWAADVGFGFDAGGLGLYLAQPLTGGGPLLFTLRLQRRF